MLAKIPERERARLLRADGWTYREIARHLDVAINSAYRWTCDIVLTEAQRENNRRGGPGGPPDRASVARRAASWSAACRAKRAAYQADGRARARAGGDPLHLQGCMLYWAEGAKGRNVVHFANSELPMVLIFRRFLRDTMGVEDARLRLALNVYTNNGLSIEQIEAHWLDVLSLPRSVLRKHMLDHTPTSSSGRAKNRLVYGVCSLRLGSTQVLQHIYARSRSTAASTNPAGWADRPGRRAAPKCCPTKL